MIGDIVFMIYDAVESLVGTIPSGMEDFVYIISCAVLIFLLLATFTLIGGLFKRFSER